jgi:hypothetical protein
MGHQEKRALEAFLLGLALIISLVSCGGSGSDANASGNHGDPSSPSREFMAPGGENEPSRYGAEAGVGVREAASRVLALNLRARASADWRGQCASLSPKAVKKVEKEDLLIGIAEGCVAAVKLAAEPLSASAKARTDALAGAIDVLRVLRSSAYALYHGSDGKDYTMPMEKADGRWTVGALAATEIP